eukprot:gene19963-21917_t
MASFEFTNDSQTRLFVHNVPIGTEFGINYSNWYIGHRFCGLHSIPHGLHFIYTSNVDKKQQHSPRNGIFLFIEAETDRNLVYRTFWDVLNKEIHYPIEKIDQEHALVINGKELGQYPSDEKHRKWISLTNFISKGTLNRLLPTCGRISHMTQVDCSAELEEKEKAKLGIEEASSDSDELKIRFTAVPKKKYPDGASPSEITKCNLDHSYTLNRMLCCFESHNAEGELLGEVQFAFVCFMIGQVYDAFEHWKTVVRLICCCDEALYNRTAFFLKFLDVLKFQLQEIPEDFFVDIVAQQNFLVQTLKILFSNIRSSDGLDASLVTRAEALEKFLNGLFDWSFNDDDDDDDDEDKPVIVEGF